MVLQLGLRKQGKPGTVERIIMAPSQRRHAKNARKGRFANILLVVGGGGLLSVLCDAVGTSNVVKRRLLPLFLSQNVIFFFRTIISQTAPLERGLAAISWETALVLAGFRDREK